MKKTFDRYTIEMYASIKGETRFINLINCDYIQEVIEKDLHYYALYDHDELCDKLVATCDLRGDNEFYEVVEPHTIECEDLAITYHSYRWVNRISW